MASLTGTKVSDTYQQLLKLTSQGVGADASAKYVEDGLGTDTPLSLSTTRVGIGTASPSSLLDVRGNSSIVGFGTDSSADFGETYFASGVAINFGYGTNSNSGGFINYRGYQNGDTQFRDLTIADGKGGTVAFFDGSAKSVGIGTNSPSDNAHIYSTSSETGLLIQSNLGGTGSAVGGQLKLALGARNNSGSGQADTQSGDVLGQIMFEGQGTDYSYQGGNIKTIVTTGDGNDNRSNQATAMTFETIAVGSVSPAERMRIESTGKIKSTGGIYFTGNSLDGNDTGISSSGDGGDLRIYTNGTNSTAFKSDGKVGIGTTNPAGELEITAGDGQVSSGVFLSNNRNTNNNEFIYFRKANSTSVPSDGWTLGEVGFQAWDGDEYHTAARIDSRVEGTISNNAPKGNFIFFTADGSDPNPSERMRLTSAGKLGIGTNFGENIASVGDGNLTVRSSDSSNHYNMVNVWQHSNSSTNIEQRIGWAFGDDGGAENAFGFAGYIGIGKEGDWVTDANRDAYMSFAVAENNTVSERMRITSSGRLVATATSTKSPINTAHTFYINQADSAMVIDNESSGNAFGLQVRYSATGHGTSGYFISCYANPSGSLQARFIVAEDGDVTNANNSYGAISDQRVKKDITDANSQWDDIKAIKIRNYKKDEAGDGSVQIGVVAQELEEAGMNGLVDEMEATDIDVENFPNINEGDKIKSVKYSVLYMKAIKALQEAMSKIETLESRIEELEPAEQDDGPVNSIKERVNSLEARVNDLENG
jgi:hypothetical protein